MMYKHENPVCTRCSFRQKIKTEYHTGCQYRTSKSDYFVVNQNTDKEDIILDSGRLAVYQQSCQNDRIWDHVNSIQTTGKQYDISAIRPEYSPCQYYDQLNKGFLASHSIFNYDNFLSFLQIEASRKRAKEEEDEQTVNSSSTAITTITTSTVKADEDKDNNNSSSKSNNSILTKKELLVLDEGHEIETRVIKHKSVVVSKRALNKILTKIDDIFDSATTFDYGDDIKQKWVDQFLVKIKRRIADEINNPRQKSDEAVVELEQKLDRINDLITDIEPDPTNWIISNIERESNGAISKVEFKPLDVAPYCRPLFGKCKKTLIMGATILDVRTFSRNIGLEEEFREGKKIKFISVGSDFPLENRPIYALNTAYLNYSTIQKEDVQKALSKVVDVIMNKYPNDKGIIHTTTYKQVEFITKYLSPENKRRLITTDPKGGLSREGILKEHAESQKPTVLFSPSLYMGLDLKDEKARFQILVKVPYPSKGDRWTDAKREKDSDWYNWLTALRLVQTCGRAVRSKEDWAHTYILDSAFASFLAKNRMPKWFTGAIVRKYS